MEEALKQFAQGNKGEVVSLRDAAGATGVLSRAKQITDTLNSLREHLDAGNLSTEECGGFVNELDNLYSKLATARGFGRKLKDIETRINEAVTKAKNVKYISTQIKNIEDFIEYSKQQAQRKHSDLKIGLKDATAEGGLKKIFQSKLGNLNDGSIDFQSNAGAKNNIQRMYDKTKVAVTYLKHIESGRNRGLLTDEEYNNYKEQFKEKFSDSLGRPRESSAAFEARLKKIYAGAKKLRKERMSKAYDSRIGNTIEDVGLHLNLSQIKNFASVVFKERSTTSQGFIDALAKLKKDASISDEATQEDDGQLRELLGNKARELARTHFAGGKGKVVEKSLKTSLVCYFPGLKKYKKR